MIKYERKTQNNETLSGRILNLHHCSLQDDDDDDDVTDSFISTGHHIFRNMAEQPEFRKIKKILKSLEEKALEKAQNISLVYGPLPLKKETIDLEFLLESLLYYGRVSYHKNEQNELIASVSRLNQITPINITQMLAGAPNWEHLKIFRNQDRARRDLDTFLFRILEVLDLCLMSSQEVNLDTTIEPGKIYIRKFNDNVLEYAVLCTEDQEVKRGFISKQQLPELSTVLVEGQEFKEAQVQECRNFLNKILGITSKKGHTLKVSWLRKMYQNFEEWDNVIKGKNLHKGQKFALFVYTSFNSAEINSFFRSLGKDSKLDLTAELGNTAIILLGAVITLTLQTLSSSEEIAKVIRYSNVDIPSDLIEATQNHSLVYEKSFLGATDLNWFDNFSGEYVAAKLIIIIINNDLGISIRLYSKYPEEREVLFPIGTRFICLAEYRDEEGRHFLLYQPVPIGVLKVKLKSEKIFDNFRIYAAKLLNKYGFYLIHLNDLLKYYQAVKFWGDQSLFPLNTWNALLAIIMGHNSFKFTRAELTGEIANPITYLEIQTTIWKRLLKEILTLASKKSVSLGLMDIMPLLALCDEIPELKKLNHTFNNSETCLATDIPSYELFNLIYQQVYSAIPKLETKDFFTIQQMRASERDSKIKDDKTTRILRNLCIPPLLSFNQLFNFMIDKKFFTAKIIDIIFSYINSEFDCINIHKDSFRQEEYLDNRELSAFLSTNQLIWKMKSEKNIQPYLNHDSSKMFDA